MGSRRERHKPADPTSDRIAMALELIRRSDEHWHGLAVWGDAIERAGLYAKAECRAPHPLSVTSLYETMQL
jgi:hypothetical protein